MIAFEFQGRQVRVPTTLKQRDGMTVVVEVPVGQTEWLVDGEWTPMFGEEEDVF